MKYKEKSAIQPEALRIYNLSAVFVTSALGVYERVAAHEPHLFGEEDRELWDVVRSELDIWKSDKATEQDGASVLGLAEDFAKYAIQDENHAVNNAQMLPAQMIDQEVIKNLIDNDVTALALLCQISMQLKCELH